MLYCCKTEIGNAMVKVSTKQTVLTMQVFAKLAKFAVR